MWKHASRESFIRRTDYADRTALAALEKTARYSEDTHLQRRWLLHLSQTVAKMLGHTPVPTPVVRPLPQSDKKFVPCMTHPKCT